MLKNDKMVEPFKIQNNSSLKKNIIKQYENSALEINKGKSKKISFISSKEKKKSITKPISKYSFNKKNNMKFNSSNNSFEHNNIHFSNKNLGKVKTRNSENNIHKSLQYSLRLKQLDTFNNEQNNEFEENNIIRVINNLTDLFKNNQLQDYLLNKSNNNYKNHNFFNNYINNIYKETVNLQNENRKKIQVKNKYENSYSNEENENFILKQSNNRIQTYNKIFSIIFNALNDLSDLSNNNDNNSIKEENESYSTEENYQNINVNVNVNLNNIIDKQLKNDLLKQFKKPLLTNEKNLNKICEGSINIGNMNKYQFKVQKQFNGKIFNEMLHLISPDILKKNNNNFTEAKKRMLYNINKKYSQRIKTDINEENGINSINDKINNTIETPRDTFFDKNYFNQDFISTWKIN